MTVTCWLFTSSSSCLGSQTEGPRMTNRPPVANVGRICSSDASKLN